MDLIISVLISWLLSTKGIDVYEPPTVLFKSEIELIQMYNRPVFAIYSAERRTIYLHESVDITTEWGKSVLVHELIHHYQELHNLMESYACFRQSERLAYNIQKDYLLSKGVELRPQLGSFNIMARSMCSQMEG